MTTRKKIHTLHYLPDAERSAPAPDELIAVRILRIDEDGRVFVSNDEDENVAVEAQTTVDLTAEHVGRIAVIKYLKGRPAVPVVLGLLRDPGALARPPVRTLVEDELILSAKRRIELRCGQSTVILERDGRIEIRGESINSRAAKSQKIRGGSVQIN